MQSAFLQGSQGFPAGTLAQPSSQRILSDIFFKKDKDFCC